MTGNNSGAALKLGRGDPFPQMRVRMSSNAQYPLDSAAGRYVVFIFIGSPRLPGVAGMLDQIYASHGVFDDQKACCFLIVNDPEEEARAVLAERVPGVRIIWDPEGAMGRALGCIVEEDGNVRLMLTSCILDPGNRVHAIIPNNDPSTHFDAIRDALAPLPDPSLDQSTWAPVLLVPNVLEPELCRAYIAYAEAKGLSDSGFMKSDPKTGETMLVVDHQHKRRADCSIEDERLRAILRNRFERRLFPAMQRAFQFKVTRMERYLIARYDGSNSGWFSRHKDNTTLATAHRRFAVSINLNAEDHEGGELLFPEFGMRRYRPPTGGAVVFSCSLLHEATPVTKGLRYCLLPFLYDEAASEIRVANAKHIQDPALRASVMRAVGASPGGKRKKRK